MSVKLYIYKLTMPSLPGMEVFFNAIANSENEAKQIILNNVQNDYYKTELISYFKDSNNKPMVYESGDFFVQYKGTLQLFTA